MVVDVSDNVDDVIFHDLFNDSFNCIDCRESNDRMRVNNKLEMMACFKALPPHLSERMNT